MPKLTAINKGRLVTTKFCKVNDLAIPKITVLSKREWFVGSCAYYRPREGIVICPDLCAKSATEEQVRNWNWPGSTVDREPFGVICHELGHHVDWLMGDRKYSYSSEYSARVLYESKEKPITNYCPNSAEWFAEMFRLFVTNHALLKQIRPKTWSLLRQSFSPVSGNDWRRVLGTDVPTRIVRSLLNKGAK